MRIVIANDHGAVALKKELLAWLESQGHTVVNLGVDAEDRADYPDVAERACAEYAEGGYDFGILLCGTGIGMSIAANKIPGIRCALVHDEFTATMAREHNDANFIAMGGRISYAVPATKILASFMRTEFQGGRHAERIAKIGAIETRGGAR
jgi:ribose 5-phosphate isomerase B